MQVTPYLKQAGRYCGIGATAGGPFASYIFPKVQQAVPLFPPIGDAYSFLKPFATLLIAACAAYALYTKKRWGAGTKFRQGFFCFIAGLFIYSILVSVFVVRIDDNFSHTYSYYSVGFWKTPAATADQSLQNATNKEAVQSVGTENIEKVWEWWSVDIVRITLLGSYLFALGGLNYGLGAIKVEMPSVD